MSRGTGGPDLVDLTLSEAAAMLAGRRLSPLELVQAHLDRIEDTNPRLWSYVTVCAERALESARVAGEEIAAGKLRGPLHGVPYGVKDTYLVAGVRTTGGSRILSGWVPDTSATVVARLERAGAVLVGKHNTWEFGTGTGEIAEDLLFPLARNPWDLARYTGGSSTGTGPSVAAGTAMFGMASDTGASIRVPAAANGVFGLKPTYGRVSRAGILPNTFSFDAPGPIARSAADIAAVMEVAAGHDPDDPTTADRAVPRYSEAAGRGVAGLSIGLVRGFGDGPLDVDDEVAAALEAVAEVLQAEGARIVECRVPFPMAEYRRIMRLVGGSESLAIHHDDFVHHHGDMGVALREKFLGAAGITAVEFLAASRSRRRMAETTAEALSAFDAVLAPAPVRTVPRFDEPEAMVAYVMGATTVWCNVTGHPAVSIPAGFDGAGLPIGVQVVGSYFDEATILAVADAHQRATEWSTRRPTLGGVSVAPIPRPAGGGEPAMSVAEAEYAGRRLGLVEDGDGIIDRLRALAGDTMTAAAPLADPLPWSLEPSQVFTVPEEG